MTHEQLESNRRMEYAIKEADIYNQMVDEYNQLLWDIHKENPNGFQCPSGLIITLPKTVSGIKYVD